MSTSVQNEIMKTTNISNQVLEKSHVRFKFIQSFCEIELSSLFPKFVSPDNCLIQALRWALTKYGDSLQGLLTSEEQIQSMTILPWETSSLREYSLHYIHHVYWPDESGSSVYDVHLTSDTPLSSTPSPLLFSVWFDGEHLMLTCGTGSAFLLPIKSTNNFK